MRFRKGTKVEVLTQKEVPSGSWRCAEIIDGNGHNYTVRYDGDIASFGKATIEKVSRKAIRPCPPSVDMLEDWMTGDVVEVFHNFSWKMATVLKVSGWNYLLVRLLGSANEFKVNKYDVRARLCWQDGEWIVIGKASNKCEDLRFRSPSSRKDDYQSQKMGTVVSRRIKGDHVSPKTINNVLESQAIPSRTLKRKQSHFQSQIEAHASRNQKIRVGENKITWRSFNVMQQPLPEKGHSRGLVHLASEFLKMILGSTIFYLGVLCQYLRQIHWLKAYDELLMSLLRMAGCCILPFGAIRALNASFC